MRIIIIGAVAAGTSAAAKASRNDKTAEIVIYEKDSDISYSGCGMPYYIGGKIDNPKLLYPRDEKYFKDAYNVEVKTMHEVLSVDTKNKSLKIKNLKTNEEFIDNYDKLVFATGARSFVPPIKGVDKPNVFTLRNIKNMHSIKNYIEQNNPKTATIIGSGFIGLELCENLKALDLRITLLEKLPQISPSLDSDMATHVSDYLVDKGIDVITSANVIEIKQNSVLLDNKREVASDIVIIATGVIPNTHIAKEAGITLGVKEAIKVNKYLETNINDIYACGDCAEQFHVVTNEPVYRPLGSTANKMGRIVGENLTGGKSEFKGVLSTGIYRLFDLTVAQTGLTEREAKDQGYDYVKSLDRKENKPKYMNGKDMIIKTLANKKDGKIIGAQIIGYEGVDKRIDVFVTAITLGAKAEDLVHLDLAYTPPYSNAKDPIMYTGMILEKLLNK